MDAALLRLFNAVRVDNAKRRIIPKATLRRTVRNGYLLHQSILPTEETLSAIEQVIGISGEKANASFHKSWAIVRDSSMEDLVIQQILHYITTYGFEALGIYRKDAVYIPNEALKLPHIKDGIPLVVIKAMTLKEILEGVVALGSGVALAQETLNDIMTVIESLKPKDGFDGFDSFDDFVEKIKNRELKALLYDFFGTVPSDPTEFLRHLVSKLTDESLLIKNKYLIEKLKGANRKFLDELLKQAPDDLAAIFFRFKPIFLALKSVSKNKTFFNRLRKQAKKLHVPLPTDYMNSVTAQISAGELKLSDLKRRLKNASVFRKARLAQALSYRLASPESIVYRVRNGKGWATDFKWSVSLQKEARSALDAVIASIAGDIRKNVKGKAIYIPSNVHYALPATEKQFTGHLPTGSYVSVPGDMIVGIHWTNTNDRVDLDLSALDTDGKIGWDAGYRSDDREVLFSGDVTDAPGSKGASELFYFKKGVPRSMILMVNYYNFSEADKVACKLLVANESPKRFGGNYMVDISKMVASATIMISRKQNILGLVTSVNGEGRVYFASISIGNFISSDYNEHSHKARNYLLSKAASSIELRDVLVQAGARLIESKPKKAKYIDLSPEVLNKTSILSLLK